MNRRELIRSARRLPVACMLALLCLSAVAQTLPPGLEPMATERIADGLYTFRFGAYRSLFLITSEGVIVTDPLSPQAARFYRAAITELTDLPVRFVVYSHAHWDHARGGQLFKDEGATVVAHSRCVENLRDAPNADVVPPDVTFDDTYSVRLGDRGLDLYYFGPSHGTCLVVMIPRPFPMLYTVDILTPRPSGGAYLPWDPQVADFHFYNAPQALRRMEELAERESLTTVIGAHVVPLFVERGRFAAAPPTGPIVQLRERREFWEGLLAAVKAEMDSGTESFLVSGRLDLSPWEETPGFQRRKFKILVDRVAAYHAIGR